MHSPLVLQLPAQVERVERVRGRAQVDLQVHLTIRRVLASGHTAEHPHG